MTSGKYDEEQSKKTEQAYLSPEILRQRERTLDILSPQAGETVIDVGCGPGLLAVDLAAAVGSDGHVVGMDSSQPMLDLARSRCAQLPQVEFIECDAAKLEREDESADAATCIQVLLYVKNVDNVLRELHRVLRPGGRAVIMETDWRSAVLHSGDHTLTERIIGAWDDAVPSPNLPARLLPLLRQHGFADPQVEGVPIISTDHSPDGYAMSMMVQCADVAVKNGVISASEHDTWLDELQRLGAAGEFFFCVNRFLFSASRN